MGLVGFQDSYIFTMGQVQCVELEASSSQVISCTAPVAFPRGLANESKWHQIWHRRTVFITVSLRWTVKSTLFPQLSDRAPLLCFCSWSDWKSIGICRPITGFTSCVPSDLCFPLSTGGTPLGYLFILASPCRVCWFPMSKGLQVPCCCPLVLSYFLRLYPLCFSLTNTSLTF